MKKGRCVRRCQVSRAGQQGRGYAGSAGARGARGALAECIREAPAAPRFSADDFTKMRKNLRSRYFWQLCSSEAVAFVRTELAPAPGCGRWFQTRAPRGRLAGDLRCRISANPAPGSRSPSCKRQSPLRRRQP